MALLIAQPIIHIEDIIVVLVVVPLIVHWLARFGQHTTRVMGGLVAERWVADTECINDIGGELP
jgi:hypothetical protein